MDSLLIVARAFHYGAVVTLFGSLLLEVAVVAPAAGAAGAASTDLCEHARRFIDRTGRWALLVSLVSWAAWLLVEASLMSGQSIVEATTGPTLPVVLTQTRFGRVWACRLGAALVVGALIVWPPRRKRVTAAPMAPLALLFAGAYLASLAFVGHAAAAMGAERSLLVISDVVHLLAAGAWVGALPGLAVLLAMAARTPSAATLAFAGAMAQRFSTVGIASVGALLVSGTVNACHLVGTVPALFGTPYGQLLAAKVLLFAAMVSLAAGNRLRSVPRARGGDVSALRALKRNTVLEIGTGAAVIAIVAVLGVSVPAAHQPPVGAPMEHMHGH